MPTNLRLGLYYCAIFIGTGASLPYMPVWFRSQGLSGAPTVLRERADDLIEAVSATKRPVKL